jgi:hypothetical protein
VFSNGKYQFSDLKNHHNEMIGENMVYYTSIPLVHQKYILIYISFKISSIFSYNPEAVVAGRNL